jgi:beta-glucanase (GH16 family)
LPAGLSFFEDGFIRGVPLTPGPGDFSVMAVDEDNDSTIKKFSLLVENKNPQTVLITNAVNKAGIPYEIAIMRNGETPNFSSNSTRKTTYTEEINFSNIGPFAGLPYIRTDINDTAATAADFLSFEIDEDAVIYVAYEKFDRQLHSTIPAWLKGWKKERGEIAAQYRYFNVYSKPFPRGKVILPGADAPRSGVVFNYFVMAKKTATAVAAQKTGPLKPDFSPPRNIPGMTLRWSDEFNIPGRPDSTKWTYENGFVRNNELQWYQRENASVKNGCLVIEGRREKLKNPRYDSSSQRWQLNREYAGYTASSLKTQGLQQFHYGRIEVRARVDTTLGSWPAIWTLGINQRWPLNGEVDVMEFYRVNNVPTILANTAYGRNQNGGPVWNTKRLELSHFIARDKDWPKKFHIWRMDWSEDSINLYLDDELLNTTLLKNTLNPDGFNPFQQPHYLLLNLAIGSNGGDPAHAKYPIKYEVDYVRYYQKQNR